MLGTATRTRKSGACTIENRAVGGNPGNMSSSIVPSEVRTSACRAGSPSGLRGWLLVYMIGLVIQALHGLGLTVGAIVIFADPGQAGLMSLVPLGPLLFYISTNIILAGYTAVVLSLMVRRRKAAIVNSIVLNFLPVLLLTLWHVFGEKSPVGTIVDSLPGLAGLAYILSSKRVRGTFICSRAGMPFPAGTHSP